MKEETTAARNRNHPKKESSTVVAPIRDQDAIESIRQLLATKPRDLLLFNLAINNGLRTGDLLKLKVSDVKHLKPGECITIKESKTGKQNILMINKKAHKALKSYMKTVKPADNAYLFPSRKGGQPLSISTVNNLVKSWTKAINLPGNYGAHTLRKTFGYMQRTKHGVGFEILARRFNHSSPAITMRYLGLTSQDVILCLGNEI